MQKLSFYTNRIGTVQLIVLQNASPFWSHWIYRRLKDMRTKDCKVIAFTSMNYLCSILLCKYRVRRATQSNWIIVDYTIGWQFRILTVVTIVPNKRKHSIFTLLFMSGCDLMVFVVLLQPDGRGFDSTHSRFTSPFHGTRFTATFPGKRCPISIHMFGNSMRK